MDNLPFVSCLTAFQSVFITLSRTCVTSSDSGRRSGWGCQGLSGSRVTGGRGRRRGFCNSLEVKRRDSVSLTSVTL